MLHSSEHHLCSKVWRFQMRLLKVVAESNSISCNSRVVAAAKSTRARVIVQLQLNEIQSGTLKDRAQVHPPAQNIHTHSRIPDCTVTLREQLKLTLKSHGHLLEDHKACRAVHSTNSMNSKSWRWGAPLQGVTPESEPRSAPNRCLGCPVIQQLIPEGMSC